MRQISLKTRREILHALAKRLCLPRVQQASAILAVTPIQPLYKFHAISNSTHHNLGVEVAQCVISREPLSKIIATRTTFLGETGVALLGDTQESAFYG